MVIPITVSMYGTVSKGLEKRLEESKSEEDSRPYRSQHC